MPFVTVPLAHILTVTPRSRLLRVDIRGIDFEFRPGQAVMVGEHGRSVPRPYSIASSPEQTTASGLLDLLVAVERDGNLGPHFGTAVPGMLLDVDGPFGSFALPAVDAYRWVLLVAGGSGIAPLRSMLDHLLRRQPSPRISLLYSVRRGDEFAFIDELQRHADAGRIELHRTVTRDEDPSWSGPRGRIGRSHFESILHEPEGTLCLVCGPDPFVADSAATLRALGVPEAQILTEQWTK